MFEISDAGDVTGPHSSEELKSLYKRGKLRPAMQIRKVDGGDWMPITKVKGFTFETPAAQPASLVRRPEPQVVPAVVQTIPADVECPFCSELIKPGAKKCRHCGEILDVAMRESARSAAPVAAAAPTIVTNVSQVTQVNVGGRKKWSRLVAVLLSLLIPGLGQLYKGQVISAVVWFVITIAGYLLIVPGVLLHFCCVCGAAMGDPYR